MGRGTNIENLAGLLQLTTEEKKLDSNTDD